MSRWGQTARAVHTTKGMEIHPGDNGKYQSFSPKLAWWDFHEFPALWITALRKEAKRAPARSTPACCASKVGGLPSEIPPGEIFCWVISASIRAQSRRKWNASARAWTRPTGPVLIKAIYPRSWVLQGRRGVCIKEWCQGQVRGCSSMPPVGSSIPAVTGQATSSTRCSGSPILYSKRG